jgi:hypothetical protein
MADKNKIILEYLENKLSEIQDEIKITQKEYPTSESFCYECGNHTHDASYNEQIQEIFISQEIERYK